MERTVQQRRGFCVKKNKLKGFELNKQITKIKKLEIKLRI